MNDKSGSARERREQIYNFIIQYKRATGGRSPTYAEIMNGVGATSKSIVHYDVARLAEAGKVTLNDVGGGRRAIGIPGELWLAPGDVSKIENDHEGITGLSMRMRDAADPLGRKEQWWEIHWDGLGGSKGRLKPITTGSKKVNDE